MTEQRSENEIETRNSLPEDLRPIFDEFVADYKYAATIRHSRLMYPISSWLI